MITGGWIIYTIFNPTPINIGIAVAFVLFDLVLMIVRS
jgi:hypothetical protein